MNDKPVLEAGCYYCISRTVLFLFLTLNGGWLLFQMPNNDDVSITHRFLCRMMMTTFPWNPAKVKNRDVVYHERERVHERRLEKITGYFTIRPRDVHNQRNYFSQSPNYLLIHQLWWKSISLEGQKEELWHILIPLTRLLTSCMGGGDRRNRWHCAGLWHLDSLHGKLFYSPWQPIHCLT